jgi:hypothetical protein
MMDFADDESQYRMSVGHYVQFRGGNKGKKNSQKYTFQWR